MKTKEYILYIQKSEVRLVDNQREMMDLGKWKLRYQLPES